MGIFAETTRTIQQAIDRAHATGGGTVSLPAGVHICGNLRLRSGVRLQLEAGAVLQAAPDLSEFVPVQAATWSRMDARPQRNFIYAEDAEDVTICGDGTIDGGGNHPCFQVKDDDASIRPYCMQFSSCRRVTVRDVRLRSSAFWMQRYFNCDDVRISGIRSFNHSNANNDGLDIDSSLNVVISDCIIDSMDDVICLKSEGRNICRNVVVSNCILATHASAIKLGTGSVGGFENVVVSNCVVRPSSAKQMRHCLNAWGGLAGIDIMAVDGGTLRHCIFSNIVIQGVETPIVVRLGNRNSRHIDAQGYDSGSAPGSGDGSSRRSCLEDVLFSGIDAWGTGPLASHILGYEGHPVTGVTLRDVTLAAATAPSEAQLAGHPNWSPSLYPCNRTVGHPLPAAGLAIRHAEDIRLERVRVRAAPGDIRPGLWTEHVAGLVQVDCAWDLPPRPVDRTRPGADAAAGHF